MIDTAQPQTGNPEIDARIAEQSLRYRMLTGHHTKDVEDEISRNYAEEVAGELVINPDLSENPLVSVTDQINTAYDEGVAVGAEDAQPEQLSSVITPSLWPMCQERARIQIGVRECAMRLDWPTREEISNGAPAEVNYREVPPHLIQHIETDRLNPCKVLLLSELRVRTRTTTDAKTGEPTEHAVWTLDTYDVRNPQNPVYKIEEIGSTSGKAGTRADVTSEFDAENVNRYPYIDANGEPVMPYVLYHARVQSRTWDYMRARELVDGTLKAASGRTHWWEGFQSSANPQRYIVDGEEQGGETRTDGGRSYTAVVTDGKSVLKIRSTKDRTATAGQWSPAIDLTGADAALEGYVRRLAVFAGLSPSDLTLTQGQSGYAIMVSRSGQRRAQIQQEPAHRMGDQLLLATASRMANAYSGTTLPTDPRAWVIGYPRPDDSQQERKALIENTAAELELGTISRIQAARITRPGISTDEDALKHLIRVAEDEARLRAALEGIAPAAGGE